MHKSNRNSATPACRFIIGLFLGIQAALGVAADASPDAADASIDAHRNAASQLAGLWGATKIFPPAGPFQVTLRRDGSEFVLSARDESERVAVPLDKQLEFDFPHGTGALRLRRENGGKRYAGHWISPPATLTYSHFASPLTLIRQSRNHWSGTAIPPEQSFSIYIFIAEQADGTLSAFLHNPERNQGVATRLHTLRKSGNRITFLDPQGELVLTGELNSSGETLQVALPWRGGTYDLKRLSRSQAPGFAPRRAQDRYGYAIPADDKDGWTVQSAAQSGLAIAPLESLIQHILDTTPESVRTAAIHSVLVAHRGNLVLEEYFHGYYTERLHDLRSATKSVTGIMAGIAIAESASLGLDTPVYQQLGAPLPANASKKRALTVEHLLNMSSGFHCDDNDPHTPGNEDQMQQQSGQPDWWQYTLALPMQRPPGEKAVYCSAGINLLGGVISTATNEWLPEFFRSRLATPLQIKHYQMNLDPLRRGYAGGGIHMRPRDFLKFGQLMLNDGHWRGKQLIPKTWARESLRARVSINTDQDYGYTWWATDLPYQDRTVASFSATGNGGQLLIIVPELELVVGFTGGNYGDFRTWIQWRDQLLPRYVFPAVQAPE